ncbi:glycosyltransferase family 2 protein [Pantoea vagans]|uniref:glycosyltransferase family 2 protein n=1 Tax=Pantoea vagans TaxID=470934 RepID=UPI00366C78CA
MNTSRVAIIMGSYNGEDFIKQQLNSIKEQSFEDWFLWISDDNSTDSTIDYVTDFLNQNKGAGKLLTGPGKGFNENFKSLIMNEAIHSEYYAFSDQDDIWAKSKLKRAVEWLDTVPYEVPAFFCSRTELIDQNNKFIGFSPDFKKKPDFKNALIQNIASGNTMVFNHAARELLKLSLSGPVVIHDWSLYLVVTACGGQVFYDSSPSVFYRQHTANVIGNSMGLKQRFRNYKLASQGRRQIWNDTNISMLERIHPHLTFEAKKTLHLFRSIRQRSLFKRVLSLKESGVYHQQLIGTLTTFVHTLMNRM